MPSGNREYWAAKIRRNIERDRRVDRELRRIGFSPMRIWEHDLKSQESLRRVERRLRGRLVLVFDSIPLEARELWLTLGNFDTNKFSVGVKIVLDPESACP